MKILPLGVKFGLTYHPAYPQSNKHYSKQKSTPPPQTPNTL